jgi:hypothetical protein
MQLSNIGRDVGEDARNGRIYLPLEWLTDAGIDPDAFLANPTHSVPLAHAVSRLLEAAEQLYRQASAGIARLPIACRFGIGAAALLYAEIGREVGRRNMDAVSGRAVVPVSRKISALLTGLAGMTLPLRPLRCSCVPEGRFLVDAVALVTPRPAPTDVFIPAPQRADWYARRLGVAAAREINARRVGVAAAREIKEIPADRPSAEDSISRSAGIIPWWEMTQRLRWTIDLFERLENRERVRS